MQDTEGYSPALPAAPQTCVELDLVVQHHPALDPECSRQLHLLDPLAPATAERGMYDLTSRQLIMAEQRQLGFKVWLANGGSVT